MSILDQILGQSSLREDSPPVQAARTPVPSAARRIAPTDEEAKKLRDKAARQRSTIASIIGMSENEEEGIIPTDAKRIDPYSNSQIPGMRETPSLNNDSPAEPVLVNSHGEELMSPTAALVAPDVTPKVFELIDPSQVPKPPAPQPGTPGTPTVTPMPVGDGGALDTIMGRQQPVPKMPTQASTTVTAESFLATMVQPVNLFEVKAKAAADLVPGTGMPEHKAGDGNSVYEAMRKFM